MLGHKVCEANTYLLVAGIEQCWVWALLVEPLVISDEPNKVYQSVAYCITIWVSLFLEVNFWLFIILDSVWYNTDLWVSSGLSILCGMNWSLYFFSTQHLHFLFFCTSWVSTISIAFTIFYLHRGSSSLLTTLMLDFERLRNWPGASCEKQIKGFTVASIELLA